MARRLDSVLILVVALPMACAGGVPSGPGWTAASDPVRSGAPPRRPDKPIVPNPHWENATGEFGLSEKNPIRVAGIAGITPRSTRVYFHHIRGPNGEEVYYRRLGSCCLFPSPNAPFGPNALLDRYAVTYRGLSEPVVFYVNFYDPGDLLAPPGFSRQ